MRRLLPILLFTRVFLLAGCVGAVDPAEAPDGVQIPLIDPGTPEATGVITFVNDPATTFELLDDAVGLDRRAARGLIDGRPFETIGQIDAVSYVGRVAMQKLLDWARDGGFVPAPLGRDAATLALVNDTAVDFVTLDDVVGLDRRAARGIVDGRPFASIEALDAVPYVGASALGKLADYALAHGYGAGGPSTPERPCVIISEYVEGQGNNNKAVELYNCGSAAVSLESIGICMVRNGDTSCTSSDTVGVGELAAGDVWTICRTRTGTFNDPYAALAAACDFELGSVARFNGNDRLVVFEDADADGDLDGDEVVLDQLGDPLTEPYRTPWAETTFRRCDLSPMASEPTIKFTQHPRTHLEHLGVAPPTDCSITRPATEGEDCLSHASCDTGLRCYGIPHDGSSSLGVCVDPTPEPGEGASCDRYSPCNDGLLCAGWTLWGEGICVPQWMAGRWGGSLGTTIPESGAFNETVTVRGLASVPVDIEVQLHIDHPRRTDLRVTLHDPNGDSAVLWDRTTDLDEYARSFVTTGISRDDAVNGRWRLEVEDLVAGQTGTVESFHLFIVSRWD